MKKFFDYTAPEIVKPEEKPDDTTVETVEENTRRREEFLGREVPRNHRDGVYTSDEYVSRSSKK